MADKPASRDPGGIPPDPEPTVTATSLALRPARPACPACGAPVTVELSMTGADGRLLTMTSCGRCDQRLWRADGEVVRRADLLRAASGRPDFELVPAARRPATSRRRAS